MANPDQRPGQIITNAARNPALPLTDNLRDPFLVDDDQIWVALQRLVDGGSWPGVSLDSVITFLGREPTRGRNPRDHSRQK